MQHPRISAGRTSLACALAAIVMCAAACAEKRMISSYYRPMPPKPRPLPQVPADATADALVLAVSAAPLDTNGNGYPDLIHASAHLFDTRYAPAIPEDGEFVFQMFAVGEVGRPDRQPIREWRIPEDEAARALHQSAFGACYRFRLSMLDEGTDVLDIPMADVVARFEPADGSRPTYAGEVATIQIGQRVVVPRLLWRDQSDATGQVEAWP